MEFTNKESLCSPQPILFYYSKKYRSIFVGMDKKFEITKLEIFKC